MEAVKPTFRRPPDFALAVAGALAVVLLMAGAFVWGIWFAVAALAASVAAFALVPRYRIAFLFLLCLIPHLGEVDQGGPLPVLFQIPFWLLAISWAYHALVRPRALWLEPKFTLVYALFIGVCILSVLLGISPSLIPDFLAVHGLGYQRLQEALMATAIGVLAMSACRTREDIERLCWTVVIVGIPSAITLFFFGPEIEPDGTIPRRKGFYLDVHPAAFHMQFTLLMAIVLLRSGVAGWKRWALVGCCLLFLSTHQMTNARSLQATVPVIILIALVLEGKTGLAFVTMAGLGIAFLVLLPVMPQNLRSNFLTIFAALTGQADGTSVQFQHGAVNLSTFAVRLEHIHWGLEVFRGNPWLGIGLGKHPWISNLSVAPTIHCYYVAILAETGILGFSLYAALVAGSLARGVRFMRSTADPVLRYFAETLLLIMASALIVFLTSMGNGQGERYIWLAMGLIASLPAIAARAARADFKNNGNVLNSPAKAIP